MKYVAIDTSAKQLIVLAQNGEKVACVRAESLMQHSVRLFPAIEDALSRAELALTDCDFLACVVGPGSFTGIRIGISAVKGLCFGLEKKALAVTSLKQIAYAEETENKLALVNAGHGNVYAEGFGTAALAQGFYSTEEVLALAQKTGAALLAGEEIAGVPANVVDPAEGLRKAVRATAHAVTDASDLAAVYLRKSSAEEGR